MRYTTDDLLVFWMTPWSKTLRDLSVQLTFMDAPVGGRRADTDAPRWVRPLCLQRWVARAIAARLDWMQAHPAEAAPRFGRASEPRWVADAYEPPKRRGLRERSEAALLEQFGVTVERLLRILYEPPKLVGEMDWTRAALCASQEIAQIYAELKRRSKAMRARALLREELARFVAWRRERVGSAGD